MASKKTGQEERAKTLWEEMMTWPHQKDSFPFIEMAKYHEHRLKDYGKAILYVDRALERISSHRQKEIDLLLHRRNRLRQKIDGS